MHVLRIRAPKVSFMNEQTVFFPLFDVLSTILCMQIGLRCHKNYSFKVVLENSMKMTTLTYTIWEFWVQPVRRKKAIAIY
jgi:hypothetical protein